MGWKISEEGAIGAVIWRFDATDFLAIGGFDEDFHQAGGEDMEFAWRFQRNGLRAVFLPEALVLHPQRPYSVRGFFARIPLLKWSLLYYQKTGQACPMDASSVT